MELELAGNKIVHVRFFCSQEAYPDRPSLADLFCTVKEEDGAAPVEIREIIHRKIVNNSEVLHETVREIVRDYFSGEANGSVAGENRG